MRRADNTPELCTSDEILDDTVAVSLDGLLSKGKRLNPDGYFKAGTDSRVSNQLLRDNKLVPESLRKRWEIERLVASVV